MRAVAMRKSSEAQIENYPVLNHAGVNCYDLVFCATIHCHHTRYRVPRKWSTAGPSAIQPSLAARLDMQCRASQEQPSDQTHGNARFEPCTR
jgi:hypothetical protein